MNQLFLKLQCWTVAVLVLISNIQIVNVLYEIGMYE